jgi:hypothetical protein
VLGARPAGLPADRGRLAVGSILPQWPRLRPRNNLIIDGLIWDNRSLPTPIDGDADLDANDTAVGKQRLPALKKGFGATLGPRMIPAFSRGGWIKLYFWSSLRMTELVER